MKSEWSIKIIMLGILSCMSSISFGGNKTSDSLLIQRMYDYRRNFAAEVCDSTRNIYVKYDVDVQKRNASLALVPSLYNISRGMRMFVGEMYGAIRFKDVKHYDIQKELQLAKQRGLYDHFYGNTDSIPTTKRKKSTWDVIGNHMFNSHSTGSAKASVRLSPLINPLYLSYSGRRGLSYHLRMGSTLNISESKRISFSPQFGYNFKIKQFFFRTPLRYTFSNKHKGWIESDVANGNRISNFQLPDYFNDFNTRLSLNYQIGKVELTPSLMYHSRTAVSPEAVRADGKETKYNSFAPSLKLSYTPSPKWPTLSANYERGIKNVMKSNMDYEKWDSVLLQG